MTYSGAIDLLFGNAATGRARLVFSGLAIQITIALFFSWSAFLEPLQKSHGWPADATLTAYRYTLIWFTIGLFAASRISRRCSPRSLARFGSLLLISGCLWAVASGGSFLGLSAGIGVLCGFGAGVAYFGPILTFRHWLPSNRALVYTLSVAAFTAGTLLAPLLFHWALTRPAASPDTSINTAFLTLALVFVLGVASMGELLPHTRAWLAPRILEAVNAAPLPIEATRERTWGRQVIPLLRLWFAWSVFFIGLLASLSAIATRIPLPSHAGGVRSPLWLGLGLVLLAVTNDLGVHLWRNLVQRTSGAYCLIFQTLLALGLAFLMAGGRFEWSLSMATLGVVGFGFGGFLALMPQFATEMLGQGESPALRFAILYSALALCATIAPAGPGVVPPGTLAANLSQLALSAALLLGFLYLLLRPTRRGDSQALSPR